MFKLPFARSKHGTETEDFATGHSIVDLRGVYKSYKTAVGDYPALKDVNLQINAGEFVSIIGKSGSGKSTLLNVLGLLDDYDAGEYRLDGKLMANLSESRVGALRRHPLGFVF